MLAEGVFRSERVGVRAGRLPMLAVGSNADPGRLTDKLGPSPVPMTLADVVGLAAGVSAHVSACGYVPAAPILTPGERHALFVLWLDERQVADLDRTEPNYQRRALPPQVDVTVDGAPVRECEAYVSERGCLLDRFGEPRRVIPQRKLLTELLAASTRLRTCFGDTPESFAVAAGDERARAQALEAFADEGWVRPQPELGA